jgi:hypothetical protein
MTGSEATGLDIRPPPRSDREHSCRADFHTVFACFSAHLKARDQSVRIFFEAGDPFHP